ncbi:hypothetical protein [Nocardia sp. NPDC050406]|uniref:hypothetical protein n=1 Tax=Nocardia sp. NPDC050406 TaxID=3364318 RepID=UPI0037A63B3D
MKRVGGLLYGVAFRNGRPIVEGTEIVGVIAHTSPLFDEAFNLFPDAAAPTLQIITLVPATNILDVRRESAV